MRKTVISLLVFSFTFTLIISSVSWSQLQPLSPSPEGTKLDCKWEETKYKNEKGFKCIGKDCPTCVKNVESNLIKLKKACCKCYRTPYGPYVCTGECCFDVLKP